MESCISVRGSTVSNGLIRCVCSALVVLVCLVGRPASAVIISSGNGQTGVDPLNANTANVGLSSTGGASVTYLGNDWAITANHVNTNTVGVGPLQIGGNSYSIDQTVQLTNPYDNSLADLKLVHLVTGGANPAPPALPTLQIGSSALSLDAQVEMVGNGQSLNVDAVTGLPIPYYWNVTGPPLSPTWTQVSATLANPDPGNASGFESIAGNTIRYGHNNVSTVTNAVPVNDGSPYTVTAFQTTFNDPVYNPGGTLQTDEAQATSGDSGGAVFSLVGSQWVLSGIMVAAGTFANQPTNVTPAVASGSGTDVFGNESYIADLSVYRSQILAVVPEPSSVILAALGGVALLFVAARRRQ